MLPTKGIIMFARESYNKEWGHYFERGKEKHYKQNSGYIITKVRYFGM
jgi:hypothetical protein